MGRWQKNKGMALATVLMVSVVMLALAGAFFAAHKNDLALMGASTKLERTKNAALSAAEFFEYKLQNDRFFCTSAFKPGRPLTETFPVGAEEPLLIIEYQGTANDISKNVVKGTIVKTGLEFEGRVLNNLDKNTVGRHYLGSTPPRSARVWITTEQGHIRKNMDFILKRSPFSAVSMLSGGDVSVSLAPSEDGKWWLGARQPSGNAVRANGTITGPEVLSETGAAVLFEPPEGLGSKVLPPYGVLQGKYLNMQMDGVSTFVEASDERLDDVRETIKGVLSPGGSEIQVPNLDADKIASPPQKFVMPSNSISFRTRDAGDGQIVRELLEGDKVEATYDGTNPASRTYSWELIPGQPAVTFDLETRTMAVTGNVELQTPNGAPFILQGFTGDSTVPDETNQPTLVLGNESNGASIKANGITVQGSVGGKGTLKAGNGNLDIRAKSSLSTTPDFGVALHSQKDVILSKPGSASSDGIPPDWDAFSTAFNQNKPYGIDKWAYQDPTEKAELAAEFSDIVLSEAGSAKPGTDPIWLALTKQFPADKKALDTYLEWVKAGKEAVTEEVYPPDPGAPEIPVLDANGDPVLDANGDPVTEPDPDWNWDPEPETVVVEPAEPAGPGMDVERYVRMREYLKTVNDGNPDTSWLGSPNPNVESRRRVDARNLVTNQLTSFQLLAGQTSKEINGQVTLSWNRLSSYFDGNNPFLSGYSADMKFRGLIYAGGEFVFDTQEQGIEIEGALVAHGDIRISNATGARIIYNSELLENLFAVNEGDTSAKLERSFWAYY